jgi:hypothetical protein
VKSKKSKLFASTKARSSGHVCTVAKLSQFMADIEKTNGEAF